MINRKYHVELKHGRKQIIVDACYIDGMFETMALDHNGNVLDEFRSEDFNEAIEAYNRMVEHYSTEELTGKYAKLRDDLRIALDAGRAVEEQNPEDGGTCNFDAASIMLPRWIVSRVEQAAKEAGTRCWKWSFYGGTRFVFAPDTNGHANARSRNAEAMTEALRNMGYDTFEYCQMD